MPSKYVQGASLPVLAGFCEDSNGALIDFSTGYTFEVKVWKNGGTAALITKTTGITGAVGSLPTKTPNVAVAWAAGELSVLPPDSRYRVQIKATRVSDSLVRFFQDTLTIEAAAP